MTTSPSLAAAILHATSEDYSVLSIGLRSARVPLLTPPTSGCTTGTGFHAAHAAVVRGAACVLLLNRMSARAEAAEAKLKTTAAAGTRVTTIEVDLQSFASVRAAAAQMNAVTAEYGGLDVLVNNAGIMGVPDR